MKRAVLFFALTLLVACGSLPPAERLERLYEQGLAEEGSTDADEQAEVEERRRERADEVREILAADVPLMPLDQLHAAAVLVDSRDPADLALARDLALDAAERGAEDGFALAAEAIDRECLQRGIPQRYGTQYIYSPVTSQWFLYEWDPATTDVERRAMGVPTLAEALARVRELNGSDRSAAR